MPVRLPAGRILRAGLKRLLPGSAAAARGPAAPFVDPNDTWQDEDYRIDTAAPALEPDPWASPRQVEAETFSGHAAADPLAPGKRNDSPDLPSPGQGTPAGPPPTGDGDRAIAPSLATETPAAALAGPSTVPDQGDRSPGTAEHNAATPGADRREARPLAPVEARLQREVVQPELPGLAPPRTGRASLFDWADRRVEPPDADPRPLVSPEETAVHRAPVVAEPFGILPEDVPDSVDEAAGPGDDIDTFATMPGEGGDLLDSDWDTEWSVDDETFAAAEDEVGGFGSGMDMFAGNEDRGWQDEIDAPVDDFDPDARQNPWLRSAESGDDPALRQARGKAASISMLLEPGGDTAQGATLSFLTTFFMRFPAPATYAAIERLARKGLSLETLRQMMALREEWSERLEWWRVRHKGGVISHPSGRQAMTWILAHKVCLNRSDLPAELMIDEEWAEEWLALRPGEPGYLSFAQYVGERVEADGAGALYQGLVENAHGNEQVDLRSRGAWQRVAPDGHRIIGPIEPMPIGQGKPRVPAPATSVAVPTDEDEPDA